MPEIKNKLYNLYVNNELDKWLILYSEYINQGFAVDFELIKLFIKVLIKKRDYDYAYSLIKSLEKSKANYDIDEDIAKLYYYCFKPEDALRILMSKDVVKNKALLVKTYMLHGLYTEAYNILLSNEKESKMTKLKSILENHFEKGAFIETEYNCFINNGNILEPGYIVFLKNSPEREYNLQSDLKRSNRPYMIWKIEDDKVYLFPVCVISKKSDNDYKLYKQKYPNSDRDRKLREELSVTTLDNILSISDKVLSEDYVKLLSIMYSRLYFDKTPFLKSNNDKFIKEFLESIEIYDIIEYVDIDTREHSIYFVVGEIEEQYQVVRVLDVPFTTLDTNIININKNKPIYRVIKLTKDKKELFLEQLSKKVITKKL